MFKARLKIELYNDWAKHVIDKFGIELRSLYCGNLDSENVLDIIYFEIDSSSQDEMISFIRNSDSVGEFEILDRKDNYVIAKVVTKYETLIYKVLKNKCFALSDILLSGNWEFWEIGSDDKKNIKKFIDEVQKTRRVEIQEVKEYNYDLGDLTSKQSESIKLALSRGYYEVPKKVDLEALSKELGVSKSTLAVHLQKAEAKIVKDYFNEHVRD